MIPGAPVGEGRASPLRGSDRRQRERDLGSRRRRSPALTNRRRDYAHIARRTKSFRPCPSGQKAVAEFESPFELAAVPFCTRPDIGNNETIQRRV